MDRTTRLKRIAFRSAHRGTKESDLILGPYALAMLEHMTDAELDEFEALLSESDSDIWDWISGASKPSGGRYSELLERLRTQPREEA